MDTSDVQGSTYSPPLLIPYCGYSSSKLGIRYIFHKKAQHLVRLQECPPSRLLVFTQSLSCLPPLSKARPGLAFGAAARCVRRLADAKSKTLPPPPLYSEFSGGSKKRPDGTMYITCDMKSEHAMDHPPLPLETCNTHSSRIEIYKRSSVSLNPQSLI